MALLGIVFLCQHKIGQANIGSVGQQKGIEIDWVSLASCYSIALKEKKPMAKLSAIMNCFFSIFNCRKEILGLVIFSGPTPIHSLHHFHICDIFLSTLGVCLAMAVIP